MIIGRVFPLPSVRLGRSKKKKDSSSQSAPPALPATPLPTVAVHFDQRSKVQRTMTGVAGFDISSLSIPLLLTATLSGDREHFRSRNHQRPPTYEVSGNVHLPRDAARIPAAQ